MHALYLYLRQLLADEEGADLAEYALVLVLISIVAIGAMTALGDQISTVFQVIVSTLTP